MLFEYLSFLSYNLIKTEVKSNIVDTENTKEMKKYEKETGKKAIWRGKVTESFRKWQKGDNLFAETRQGKNRLIFRIRIER